MISREKCLEWAKEEDFTIFVVESYLRIAQRIYAEGQKDMRERAAKVCSEEGVKGFEEDCSDWGRGAIWCETLIKDLEIE